MANFSLILLCRDKSRTASKMKPWQAYAHGGVVALAVWFCRETIFEALQWWNGRPPSDGLLLGTCILLVGLACVPIVALHFSHAMVLILGFHNFVTIFLGVIFKLILLETIELTRAYIHNLLLYMKLIFQLLYSVNSQPVSIFF